MNSLLSWFAALNSIQRGDDIPRIGLLAIDGLLPATTSIYGLPGCATVAADDTHGSFGQSL